MHSGCPALSLSLFLVGPALRLLSGCCLFLGSWGGGLEKGAALFCVGSGVDGFTGGPLRSHGHRGAGWETRWALKLGPKSFVVVLRGLGG